MTTRGVLFDFDFTLADPSAWLIPAWTAALAAIGVPRPDSARLSAVVGRPLKAQYAEIVGEAPSGARFDIFERCYREYRDRHAPEETRLYPGVAAAVENLHRAGMLLGIVSTGTLERLETILTRTGLRGYFRLVEGGSQDKAAAIVKAVSALGIEARDTVYAGDHPDDCRAAARAGADFLAVGTGVHRKRDFPPNTRFLASAADVPTQILPAE